MDQLTCNMLQVMCKEADTVSSTVQLSKTTGSLYSLAPVSVFVCLSIP